MLDNIKTLHILIEKLNEKIWECEGKNVNLKNKKYLQPTGVFGFCEFFKKEVFRKRENSMIVFIR